MNEPRQVASVLAAFGKNDIITLATHSKEHTRQGSSLVHVINVISQSHDSSVKSKHAVKRMWRSSKPALEE